MKIDVEQIAFRPITVTIQTIEELDVFVNMVRVANNARGIDLIEDSIRFDENIPETSKEDSARKVREFIDSFDPLYRIQQMHFIGAED